MNYPILKHWGFLDSQGKLEPLITEALQENPEALKKAENFHAKKCKHLAAKIAERKEAEEYVGQSESTEDDKELQ